MQIVIDGVKCECQKGEHLIDVAMRNGINIPTFCHHPSIPYRGCCRQCIVEVSERGHDKVVAACIYPVNYPCEVRTDTPRILQERDMLMAFMNRRAPSSKDIADLARRWVESEGFGLRHETPEFAKCSICGKPIGTKKRFQRALQTFPDIKPICSECKQSHEAEQIGGALRPIRNRS